MLLAQPHNLFRFSAHSSVLAGAWAGFLGPASAEIDTDLSTGVGVFVGSHSSGLMLEQQGKIEPMAKAGAERLSPRKVTLVGVVRWLAGPVSVCWNAKVKRPVKRARMSTEGRRCCDGRRPTCKRQSVPNATRDHRKQATV